LMGAALLLDLDWWRGLVAAAVAVVLTVLVVARAVRRIGGVTGDILGASIEVGLAGMLLALT
jgi:adenosylcobinamide-GDP ribazoletransferase